MLIFGSLLNCIIYFYDNPIDRPPTKEVLKIVSNSNTNKILTLDGTVFANFIRTNKIFVKNNLSIKDISWQNKFEDINLDKESFWFLCLNNARFGVGKNILPDSEQCKFLDNYSYLILDEEIRLPDYLLKKYIYR